MPAAMRQVLEKELASIEKAVGPLVERRDAIQNLMAAYEANGHSTVVGPDINSLDMAKTVIQNAGRPLRLAQIKEEIHKTYGVKPAKTLYQMLYKRAKLGERFFRTEQGEFGLKEMVAEIQTVLSSASTGRVDGQAVEV